MKASLALALSLLPSAAALAGPPPCTGEAYLNFRAATERAKEVKPLLPLLAQATRQLSVERPAAFKLDNLQQASDKKNPQVEQAAVQDGRCVVNVTATDAAGKARKGMYMFELEDGQWKLLSFGWPE